MRKQAPGWLQRAELELYHRDWDRDGSPRQNCGSSCSAVMSVCCPEDTATEKPAITPVAGQLRSFLSSSAEDCLFAQWRMGEWKSWGRTVTRRCGQENRHKEIPGADSDTERCPRRKTRMVHSTL